jgi:hypothetical protein
MKKLFFSTFAIASILCVNTNLFGQSAEEQISEMKVFGMGMHIEQFKLNDLVMDIAAPSNKIVFTVTPTNYFRIEPEIGFNYFNDKDSELEDKSISLGLGGVGMYQRGKTNIYGGFRFEYSKFSNEYKGSFSGDVETEETNRIAIGPAIGAEFFFGQHFSIGGEIGIKYMNFNTTNSQYPDGEDSKQDCITTDTGLLCRFYF